MATFKRLFDDFSRLTFNVTNRCNIQFTFQLQKIPFDAEILASSPDSAVAQPSPHTPLSFQSGSRVLSCQRTTPGSSTTISNKNIREISF